MCPRARPRGQGRPRGLHLRLSLIVFQLGGLHYRLCYSMRFIITLNESLGLQLLAQNS